MKVLFAVLFFFSVMVLKSQTQGIFVPVEFQKAVERGTRSYDGKPGPKYFQNRCDYKMTVDFDPLTAKLSGNEVISFHNNSRDSVNFMVIRLYQNYLKKGASRQTSVDPSDLHDGVKLHSLKVEGETYGDADFQYAGTTLYFPLRKKIAPSSVAKVEVEWSEQLPNKTLVRMGRYDSTSYFVGYWFPQISVYDDMKGWALESYTGVQEFYNEYGDFDVEVKLPGNYLMWATGELQNAGEIYSDAVLSRIGKSHLSDTVVRVVTAKDFAEKTIFRPNAKNIWHFKASNVSDFAFGVSDHYVWDAVSVVVDRKTQRRAVANATYKVNSEAGDGIAEIAALTMKRMSETLIGISYPYPQNTIFEGDFGMEFPMMCNDGPAESDKDEVFVTSHEVSHTYFPFMVGTNETRYGWVDEGLITVIPKEIEIEKGNTNAHYYVGVYGKYNMGRNDDVPPVVPSTQLDENVIMMVNYGRAATGFYFLRETMGADKFSAFLAEYIRRWEGKHPTPTDMFFTLNSFTGEDWAWYWDPWFNRYGYADLKVKEVKVQNQVVSLKVEKAGLFPVPLKITYFFNDGTSETELHSAAVWKKENEFSTSKKITKTLTKIEIGDANIPDAFPKNNKYEVK